MSRGAARPLSVSALVSGGLLVAAALVPWVRSGLGSSLRGIEIAAALRSGPGAPSWAPAVGLAIVFVAFAGVAHVGSALSAGRSARLVRAISGSAVVAGVAVAIALLDGVRWGAGPVLALMGGLIGLGTGIAGERIGRPAVTTPRRT